MSVCCALAATTASPPPWRAAPQLPLLPLAVCSLCAPSVKCSNSRLSSSSFCTTRWQAMRGRWQSGGQERYGPFTHFCLAGDGKRRQPSVP